MDPNAPSGVLGSGRGLGLDSGSGLDSGMGMGSGWVWIKGLFGFGFGSAVQYCTGVFLTHPLWVTLDTSWKPDPARYSTRSLAPGIPGLHCRWEPITGGKRAYS
eukprot:4870793-Pyramimonas_sp.AAC.1